MLLPWSRTSTLAICNHGVALDAGVKKPQLLTDANFKWTEQTQLNEILLKYQDSIKNHAIKVILSNFFVRYLVLPWQDSVFTEADWKAIAQHEFRKQHGALANNWLVSVHLQEYGQAILAAAIDNKLYSQLHESAAQLKFDVVAVEPLLMTLLNQNLPNTWALIAEPERLVLCQIKDGTWQQVFVDSPPAGHEYQHAERLIQRSFLPIDGIVQHGKVATYVSAALLRGWQDSIDGQQRIITKTSSLQPHAVWMASI